MHIYIYIYILPKGGAIFWGITLAFDDFAELLKIVDNLELWQSKSGQRELSATMIKYFKNYYLIYIVYTHVFFFYSIKVESYNSRSDSTIQ